MSLMASEWVRLRRGSTAIRIGRYRLYWAKRLPVLRLGGACDFFRASVDYVKLAQTAGLGTGQFITFAQSIGYPQHKLSSRERRSAATTTGNHYVDAWPLLAGGRCRSK